MTASAVARAADPADVQSPDWALSIQVDDPGQSPQASGLEWASRRGLWVGLHGLLFDLEALAHGPMTIEAARPVDLVLRSIEREGLHAAVRTLRGVFVLIVADSRRRETVLFRDPLGSHPLFFARAGDRLVCADSAQGVLRSPGISRRLNRAALADHLCHRWPDPAETFFAEVRRVLPGHRLQITASGVTTSRYWDPAPDDETVNWATDDEVAAFPALLDRAVDRCLSTGPAGIFLSGGLDSISVAAVARDRARDAHPVPWALSLAMPDPNCDERATQTRVAAALGLRQHLVEFDEAAGPDGLLRAAVDLGGHLSSPLLNIWGPAYLTLATRAAGDGVRTILSGSGGDEWLSVSPYLSADLLARGDLAGWWKFFGAFRRSYTHPWHRHVWLAAWAFGARPLASRALSRAFPTAWERRRRDRATRRDPSWVAPDPELRRHQKARIAGALDDANPPHGFYIREVRSGLCHALSSWELEEQFEFGRRVGVRFLHPYWDADLVDMLYRTPPSLLTAGGRAKSLVRNAMARRFPDLGLDRQRKVAGTSFYRHLVETQAPAVAAGVGRCRVLADLGVISADAARDCGQAGWASLTNRWDVLNLETWVRANTA